ncbi:MAG: formate dehydrogenase subunit delta [Planctomycetes bacterium]|nr:formate dehydrogenase subunit delta [Planctomycetota bacterium]
MDVRKLVKMANEIGAFFAADPDHGLARENIALHLQRFWEPRMRRRILLHLDQGGEGLSEPVREALVGHRGRIEPRGGG